MVLNENLANKLNVSKGDRQQINDLHTVGEKLIEVMALNKPDTIEFWRALSQWRYNQCLLQNLWGFPADPSMWQEYKEIPWCRCPRMDNSDVGHHIYIHGYCPIHAHEVKQ